MTTRAHLPEQLAALEQAGLIRRSVSGAPGEYVFRHVLSQEGAYQSLLKQDRRRLHLAVGVQLERLAGGQPEAHAAVLGVHFMEAGEYARALPYVVQAAGEAAGHHAHTEATALYGRAIDVAGRAGAPLLAVTDLVLKRGRILEIMGQQQRALETYAEMLSRAAAQDDQPAMLACLLAQATLHSVPSVTYDIGKGAVCITQALALAQRLGDRAAECKALWLRSLRAKFLPDLASAREHGEHCVKLARELGLSDQLAYMQNDLFVVYALLGRTDLARVALEEARALWTGLHNLPLLADALANLCHINLLLGRLDAALDFADQATAISQSIQNVWGLSHSTLQRGLTLLMQARYREAARNIVDGRAYGEQAQFMHALILDGLYGAAMYADLGQPGVGLELATRALKIADTSQPTWRGMPLNMIVQCQIRLGRHEDALRSYAEAGRSPAMYEIMFQNPYLTGIQVSALQGDHAGALQRASDARDALRASGFTLYLPRILACEGQALLALNEPEKAGAALREAIRVARETGVRHELWRAYALLAASETQRGDMPAAQAATAAARAEIDFIRANLAQDALRVAFEQQAEVRALRAV